MADPFVGNIPGGTHYSVVNTPERTQALGSVTANFALIEYYIATRVAALLASHRGPIVTAQSARLARQGSRHRCDETR